MQSLERYMQKFSIVHVAFFLGCCLLFSSCEQQYGLGIRERPILETSTEITYSSTTMAKADVIFVIDNSASTLSFQSEIQSALQVFSQAIWNSGLDFQVAVLSTDSYMGAEWFSSGWNTQECISGNQCLNNSSNRVRPYDNFPQNKLGPGRFLHKTSNRFIRRNDYVGEGAFRSDFLANLTLGTGGWPIESSLLSVTKALSTELRSGYNVNFIRSDAALQVVAFPMAESDSAYGGGDEFGPRTPATNWPWDNVSINAVPKRISNFAANLHSLKSSVSRIRFDVIGDKAALPNYEKAIAAVGQGEFLDYQSGDLSSKFSSLANSLIETSERLVNSIQLELPVYEVISVSLGGVTLEASQYRYDQRIGLVSIDSNTARENSGKTLSVQYRKN